MKKHASWLTVLAVCAVSSMALAGPQENTKTRPVQPPTQPQTRTTPQQQPKVKQPTDAMAVYKARSQMRQVWAEHVVYARNYIISATGGLSDAQVVSNRLLENATDIGNTLEPYYGTNAAQKLTTLMREHVMILAELAQVSSGEPVGNVAGNVNVAPAVPSSDRTGTNGSTDRNMGGTTGSNSRSTGAPAATGAAGTTAGRTSGMNKDVDKDKLSEVQRRLEINGRSIAAFLNSANPNWKQSNFEDMLQNHVQVMVDQVTARAQGDWQGDIQAFDQAMEHVFQFADLLSQGIERQFPDRFAQASN